MNHLAFITKALFKINVGMRQEKSKTVNKTGKVILAGAGPGDPGLVTLKAYLAIKKADIIIYDSLINSEILSWAKPEAILNFMGKRCGEPHANQEEICRALIQAAEKYKVVLRLKGGDPFIFGRGGEEAFALKKAGISFEVIPGISSSVAGPTYAGIPVTHRGLSASYAVITGHEAIGKVASEIQWESLKGIHTLVFLMGVENRQEIARHLIQIGRQPNEAVAFIQDATLSTQKVIKSSLEEVVKNPPLVQAPAVMLVGPTIGLSLDWFEPNYSKEFQFHFQFEPPSLRT